MYDGRNIENMEVIEQERISEQPDSEADFVNHLGREMSEVNAWLSWLKNAKDRNAPECEKKIRYTYVLNRLDWV